MKPIDGAAFLKDVGKHRMKALLDNGLYRHIRFQQPNNSNLWFELVTWPGVLTIHGDMGTWTFSRVPEMFSFFRDDKLRINASYWAEKLRHGIHGGSDGAKVFSEELFREQLQARLTDYYSLAGEDLDVASGALRCEVLSQDNKYDLLIAARDFSCELPSRGGRLHFDSCDLPSGEEYAYQFLWCLYAIVWGIQQYDKGLPA